MTHAKERLDRRRAVLDGVADEVHRLMKQEGVTKGELARRCGRGEIWVQRVLAGYAEMKVADVVDVGLALGVGGEGLFCSSVRYACE